MDSHSNHIRIKYPSRHRTLALNKSIGERSIPKINCKTFTFCHCTANPFGLLNFSYLLIECITQFIGSYNTGITHKPSCTYKYLPLRSVQRKQQKYYYLMCSARINC